MTCARHRYCKHVFTVAVHNPSGLDRLHAMAEFLASWYVLVLFYFLSLLAFALFCFFPCGSHPSPPAVTGFIGQTYYTAANAAACLPASDYFALLCSILVLYFLNAYEV